MPFVVTKGQTAEDSAIFSVWHVEGQPAAVDTPGGEEIRFHLRRHTGKDIRRFGDLSMASDEEGNTISMWGTVAREKVIAGVIQVDGIVDEDGKPQTKMTADLYDILKGWILQRLLKAVNDHNSVNERAEGE